MLFTTRELDDIDKGLVTAAIRRWKRPTVRTGGTLTTAAGVLAIESVEKIAPAELSDEDAARAGWSSAAEALHSPGLRRDGDLYYIRFHKHGDDPRIALREQDEIPAAELGELTTRLSRMDLRSQHGPWTQKTLELIDARPAERAGDLAEAVGRERQSFKAEVRKLKALGLTESLDIGYRLSPRGRVVLAALQNPTTR